MALGGEMDYSVDVIFTEYLAYSIDIYNVCLYKRVVRLTLNILEVGEVAGVCEFVKIDNIVFRVSVDE